MFGRDSRTVRGAGVRGAYVTRIAAMRAARSFWRAGSAAK